MIRNSFIIIWSSKVNHWKKAIRLYSYFHSAVRTFLFDVDPIPQAWLMELVSTFQDETVVSHFIEADGAAGFLFPFIPNFYFLS